MCNKLREVTFTIEKYGYIPNSTQQKQDKMVELAKERKGYFHRWVDDVDNSKDIPYIKTMALVEDSADGKIYMVEYNSLKFSRMQQ